MGSVGLAERNAGLSVVRAGSGGAKLTTGIFS